MVGEAREVDEKTLAEIEARAAAATPGPWRVDGEDDGFMRGAFAVVCDGGVRCRDGAKTDRARILLQLNGHFEPGGDAAFIAAAREAVPALCAEVRALRRKLADVERDLADFRAVARGRV
jgi:hypothetical protein